MKHQRPGPVLRKDTVQDRCVDVHNYEATIEDPKVFTRPWKMSMPLYRRFDSNMQILEYECYRFDETFRGGPAERP